MTEYAWRTTDFRPATLPGWRALFLKPDGRRISPLVGWLIQDETTLDDFGGSTTTGDRRVIAAVTSEYCEATPVTDLDSFWCVLDPDEPEPSAEEEAQERQRRRGAADYRAKRAAS